MIDMDIMEILKIQVANTVWSLKLLTPEYPLLKDCINYVLKVWFVYTKNMLYMQAYQESWSHSFSIFPAFISLQKLRVR